MTAQNGSQMTGSKVATDSGCSGAPGARHSLYFGENAAAQAAASSAILIFCRISAVGGDILSKA
jgi:hypothetical protein